MNYSRTRKIGLNRRLWNWTTRGWVAEVPEDIACCEFDCRVSRCTQGQWKTCAHRLRHTAVHKKHLIAPHIDWRQPVSRGSGMCVSP
jgi:hypothetical protein